MLPAGSRDLNHEKGGRAMRILGLDIDRSFAEVVALEDGVLRRLGRVDVAAVISRLSPGGCSGMMKWCWKRRGTPLRWRRSCVLMWAVW